MNAAPMANAESAASSEAFVRLKRITYAFFALFAAIGGCAWSLNARAPGVLLTSIGLFLAWCALMALVCAMGFGGRRKASQNAKDERGPAKLRGKLGRWMSHIPFKLHGMQRWLWAALVIAAVLLCGYLGWRVPWWGGLRPDHKTSLQIATVALLVSGGLLHFFSEFAMAVQRRLSMRRLDSLVHLARIGQWSCLGGAVVAFLFLSTAFDLGGWLAWPLLGLTGILIAEPLLLQVIAFYHPADDVDASTSLVESALLDAVFGRGETAQGMVARFEEMMGAKIGEMWLLRFLRRTFGWLVLGLITLGWISTCLTMIPVGSRGVRSTLGRYEAKTLAPGLHVAWPMPCGKIDVVPTEQIRTVSIGFQQDLSQPVLWDNVHVRGEQNLLVGNGESLITINIPILYRVKDAMAYVTGSSNPTQAIADLAERKLLYIMGSRDGFAVMIDDRAKMAGELQSELQREIDQYRLGVQIEFVGLKDVHPPVDVVPDYQNVVSAQETMEAVIDDARASRAKRIPAAQAKANAIVSHSSAVATARAAQAQGDAARFLSLAKEYASNARLLQLRMRLEAVEETLDQPAKTVLAVPQKLDAQQYILDLR